MLLQISEQLPIDVLDEELILLLISLGEWGSIRYGKFTSLITQTVYNHLQKITISLPQLLDPLVKHFTFTGYIHLLYNNWCSPDN